MTLNRIKKSKIDKVIHVTSYEITPLTLIQVLKYSLSRPKSLD